MAAAETLHEYLYGEKGVQNAIASMMTTLDWTDSEPPYRALCKHLTPGMSGWTAAAEIKIARKDVMNVEQFMSELETQIIEKLGTNPTGKLIFTLTGAGKGASALIHRQREIAPPDQGSNPHSADMLLRLLNEERAKNEHLTTQMQIGYTSAQQTILGLANANSVLATQRTVSSSAADTGGLTGLIGLAGLIFTYPLLKDQFGIPKDATVEDTVRALQLGMGRMIGIERRGTEQDKRLEQAADNERAPIPASAVGDSQAPAEVKAIDGPTAAQADILATLNVPAIAAAMALDPKRREQIFDEMMQNATLKEAASAAYLKSLRS